ncbi:uncharacterized protein PpBr36_10600 [Pyricularia pennisetigena]|uniref:uncharacterized protein n=1 Tax=Pyricularia pennisetigena TaxID=1578925 RepID=UPI0011511BD7|nr:uncharacterized protein PpBr36_10600 [Pyricularia pennisetigena]TLS21093.1 hypothetical protein PpBr36_10600 [Pyricularia pennisetigena]
MPPISTPPAPRSILRNRSLQSSYVSSSRNKVCFVDLTGEDGGSLLKTIGNSSASKSRTAGRGLPAPQVNSSPPSPVSSPSARTAATLSANKSRRSSEAAVAANSISPRGLPSQTHLPTDPHSLHSYSARTAQTQPSSSFRAASVDPDALPACISGLKPTDRYSAKNKATPNIIDLTTDNNVAPAQLWTEEKLPSLDDAKAQVSKAIRKVNWSLRNDERLKDQLLFTEELLAWDSSASDSDSQRFGRRQRIRGTRYVANMSLLPRALERSSKTGVPPIVPTTKRGQKPAQTSVDRLMNDGIERGFNKDWLRSTIGRKTRRIRFHETGIDFLIATRKEKRRQEREGDERARRRVEECDKVHIALALLARDYKSNHAGRQDENVPGPEKASHSTELDYKHKPVIVQSSTARSPSRSPISDGSLKDWADAFSILDFDEAGRLRNASPALEDGSAQSLVSLQRRRREQAPSPGLPEDDMATALKGHSKDPVQQQQHWDSPDEMPRTIPDKGAEPAFAKNKAAFCPDTVKIKPEAGQQSYTGISDDELIALKRENLEESFADEEDEIPRHTPSQTLHRKASHYGVPSRSSLVHIKCEATSDEEADSVIAANTPATIFTGPKRPVAPINDFGLPASSKKPGKKTLATFPSVPHLHSNPLQSTFPHANLGKYDQDVPRLSLKQSGSQADHRQSSASKKRKTIEDAEGCPAQSKKPRNSPTTNVNHTKSDDNHQGGMAPTTISADVREKKVLKNRRARLNKKARKERQRKEEARAAAVMAKKKHVRDEQKKPDGKAPATTPPKIKKATDEKNTSVAKSPAKGLSGRGDGRKRFSTG